MGEQRLKLAVSIMDLLRNESKIQDVYLRGSMATGATDEFSDIDIGIDVSGSDNGIFAAEILPKIISENLSIVFFDWSPSLLPKQYIQSYFVSGYSPFWFVDIECIASPHFRTVTKVQNDEVGHLIKLWVQTTKYHLRSNSSATSLVNKLARRVLSSDQIIGNSSELLQAVLNKIDIINSNPQYDQVIDKCFRVCSRLLR